MSVRTMAKVWELSTNRGNDLLMLLAIADFADDDGNAYPAVQTLADKCRMKSRNANVILAALRASGELEVRQNEGPHGTNRYRIVLPAFPLQNLTGVQKHAALQKRALTPAKTCPKPLHVLTDEPSVNHQEPSTHARDAKKPHRSRSPSASDSAEEGFATFWEQYPKKVAKPQALKAWKKIKPAGQILADLMAGLERQKVSADWQKDGGQFIPHPATWLNGRRWEDQPTGTAAAKTTVPDLAPKPGDTRMRWNAPEVFVEGMGWIPA
jgi:hypothetical protein